jgi:hypothetical protein
MPRKQTGKQFLYFLVFVSLFSFFLVTLVALLPPEIQDNIQRRKQSTGSLFIFICLLGMISVFFPRQCSMIFHDDEKISNSGVSAGEKEGVQRSSKIFGVVLSHGHHPECQGFHHHEFTLGQKTFCMACTGLLFGAVLATFGAFFYFFLGWFVGIDALILVVFGITGVALCLLQYTFFDVHSGLIRFCLNTLFILGMFLIIAGIDRIVQSSSLNFFLVGLFVFWLFTRILLSKNKHDEVCQICNQDCKLKK